MNELFWSTHKYHSYSLSRFIIEKEEKRLKGKGEAGIERKRLRGKRGNGSQMEREKKGGRKRKNVGKERAERNRER